jgi:hypothetical protein
MNVPIASIKIAGREFSLPRFSTLVTMDGQIIMGLPDSHLPPFREPIVLVPARPVLLTIFVHFVISIAPLKDAEADGEASSTTRRTAPTW